jgi:hypothetical protein
MAMIKHDGFKFKLPVLRSLFKLNQDLLLYGHELWLLDQKRSNFRLPAQLCDFSASHCEFNKKSNLKEKVQGG